MLFFQLGHLCEGSGSIPSLLGQCPNFHQISFLKASLMIISLLLTNKLCVFQSTYHLILSLFCKTTIYDFPITKGYKVTTYYYESTHGAAKTPSKFMAGKKLQYTAGDCLSGR